MLNDILDITALIISDNFHIIDHNGYRNFQLISVTLSALNEVKSNDFKD